MAQHKWHKEIKAFVDGETVLAKPINLGFVQMYGQVAKISMFDNEDYTFYIMPKPKEPQYLYVYLNEDQTIDTLNYKPLGDVHRILGKIKLEVDDV